MYLVAADLPGRLFIMPCPSGDHLRQDINAYCGFGVDIVVSMLAVEEAAKLGLSDEEAVCAKANLAFMSSPIDDFGLPDGDEFETLIDRIVDLLKNGTDVAVHCRAGIGRSGMVTAATLIALGHNATRAIEIVSASRGVLIPDTVEQGKFIAEFAERKFPDFT